MYPNVVTKILLESAPNALFADIFIIFLDARLQQF